MAGAAGLWLVLATDGGNREWVLAALLRWGPLAVVGLRLVLELVLFMGMGAIPLWSLVQSSAPWMGLDAGSDLGTGLGDVALFRCVLRLGAASARSAFHNWSWSQFSGGRRRRQL